MQYLTFEEYKDLGGKIDSSAFTVSVKQAQRKLDYLTNGGLVNATVIPDEVKELLVLYVDMLSGGVGTSTKNVKSYSNGVESFSYEDYSEEELNAKFYQLAKEYLWNTGLLYRGGAKFEHI